MTALLRVRVQAISPDRLSLTLTTGEQVSIPRLPNDSMDDFTVGEDVTLTITRSPDLLNELLRISEDHTDEDTEKNSGSKKEHDAA